MVKEGPAAWTISKYNELCYQQDHVLFSSSPFTYVYICMFIYCHNHMSSGLDYQLPTLLSQRIADIPAYAFRNLLFQFTG